MNVSSTQPAPRPDADVLLVGAGVVGQSILAAHTDAGVSVCIADQSEPAVRGAVSQLNLDQRQWDQSEPFPLGDGWTAVTLAARSGKLPAPGPPIVIESITERIEVKQAFFAAAERLFGAEAVLCSNTSTLPISRLAQSLSHPQRFCGMHFFMPVTERSAVELVCGQQTSAATAERCAGHIRRLGKEPLAVGDGPGFVVNRLLTPYLNESLALLGRGVSAEQIERAALAYGMPMSPLELIDLIGTRTAFDAGRVFWQAFPTRVDPSPILPALVKRGRLGRHTGGGFYDYADGVRSERLATATLELCDQYRRNPLSLEDDEVVHLLSIPMWIEAALARRDGIVRDEEHFNLAMRGGLGYDPARNWMDFYDQLGSHCMLHAIENWSPTSASMNAAAALIHWLKDANPSQAMRSFAC